MLHEGFVFYTNATGTPIPSGEVGYGLLKTGSGVIHLKRLSLAAGEGPLTIELYENSVVSADGTPNTIINANRLSPYETSLEVFDAPTVTDPGDPLLGQLFVPGSGNNTGVVADTGTVEEVILKPNTNYLIAVANGFTQEITVGYTLVWYEVDWAQGSTANGL